MSVPEAVRSLTSSAESATYPGAAGPEVMDVWRAEDSGRSAPALFLAHGGGWTMGDRHELDDVARAAVDAGFTVFNLEYGLSSPGPSQVLDIRSAVTSVLDDPERYGIDPGRVGMLGSSAGASLVAEAGLQLGGRVRAVVGWSGAYDLYRAEAARYPYPLIVAASTYVRCDLTVRSCRESAGRQSSPAAHVDSASPAMFLVNSDSEVVPVEQTTLMATALRGAGRPVETLILPGTRHASQFASDATGPSLAFLSRSMT